MRATSPYFTNLILLDFIIAIIFASRNPSIPNYSYMLLSPMILKQNNKTPLVGEISANYSG
jgi:hypothetical protein